MNFIPCQKARGSIGLGVPVTPKFLVGYNYHVELGLNLICGKKICSNLLLYCVLLVFCKTHIYLLKTLDDCYYIVMNYHIHYLSQAYLKRQSNMQFIEPGSHW